MLFDSNSVTIIMAGVAFVAWLVRLEYKANTTADNVKDLSGDVYKHHSDKTIHASETELNRRFDELGKDVHDLKDDLRNGFKDMNGRFDNLLTK